MMKLERRAAVHGGESRRRQRRRRHPAGHVTLVSGWQGDVVPTATNHTIQVPVAKKSRRLEHHRTARAALHESDQGNTTALVIPRGQPSPYPPASLDTAKARLVSATAETATGAKEGARENSRAPTGRLRIARRRRFRASRIRPESA